MINKLLVQSKIRYVVATLDEPTLYITKNMLQGQYLLTADVSRATKAVNKSIALDLLGQYKIKTEDVVSEFVVLPVKISYELINESGVV